MATKTMTAVPNDVAAAAVSDKLAVKAQVFKQMLPEIKARAICVSGIQDLDAVQRVRDAIATLPQGANWNDVKKQVTAEISPYLVTAEDAEGRTAQMAAARARAELLLRTHGFQAYAAARYRNQFDPASASGYLRYETQGDVRVRPEHKALDGVILPKSDPFWQTHYPPWDWGCRCLAIEMEDDEVTAIRKTEADLPADKRTVLSESQRAAISSGSGRLARDGRSYDLTPREGDKAYAWQPGRMQIPLDQVLDKYDVETQAVFAATMRTAVVPGLGPDEGNMSVWDYLLAALKSVSPAAAAEIAGI